MSQPSIMAHRLTKDGGSKEVGAVRLTATGVEVEGALDDLYDWTKVTDGATLRVAYDWLKAHVEGRYFFVAWVGGDSKATAALPASKTYVIPLPDELKGGAGSGNFGHAGRPGQRGGSAGGGGRQASSLGAANVAGPGSASPKKRFLDLGLSKPATAEEARKQLEEADKAYSELVEGLIIQAVDAEAQYVLLKTRQDMQYERYGSMAEELAENPVGFADVTAALQRREDAKQDLADAEAEHREALLGVVKAERRANFFVITDERKLGEETLAIVNEGSAGFARIVGSGKLDGEGVNLVKTTGRSAFDSEDDLIKLGTGSGQRTMVHELGHWFENRVPGAQKKAYAFWQARTAGEEHVSLAKITGMRYRGTETTRPDKFFDPYVGKIYPSKSKGKIGTEIISMGIEAMFDNPAKFARADPGHFDLIWSLIRP